MKVMNHCGLCYAKVAYYSPDLPLCLGAWLIWPCLIIEILTTWVEFLELTDYCSVINSAFTFHATNVFVYSWNIYINIYSIYVYIYLHELDVTQSQFFKQSLTGLNLEFFLLGWQPSLSYYLPIADGRIVGLIPFPRVLVLCEMKTALRINFFFLLRTFCPHLGSFCVVPSFTTFRPNFTSGLLRVIYRNLG